MVHLASYRLQHASGEGTSSLEPFDPLLEHRAWSPWLAVADGDTLPTWMRIASLLLVVPCEGRPPQGAESKGSSRVSSSSVSDLLAIF